MDRKQDTLPFKSEINKERIRAIAALTELFGGKFYIAVGSGREREQEFQVMTDTDLDFFDWYCFYYENLQWHETPFEATFYYFIKRTEWVSVGSPKWNFKSKNNISQIKK